jgi:hypothetical protein
MNLVSHIVSQIETPLARFKCVGRCLIHSLLFQRVIERVAPKEVSEPELESIDYICNPRFESIVDEELEKVRGLLRKKKFIQLTVSFYRIIKEGGWFSAEEKVEWERWTIPIRLVQHLDLKESSIKSTLQEILINCDRHTNHVPGGKIVFSIYDASEEKGWTLADLADIIKKGPPSLM